MHYYIYKISSDCLDRQLKTTLKLEDAIKDSALVRIEDSQMLRTLRSQKNYVLKYIGENKVFIEDLVSLIVETDEIYDQITCGQKGFFLNNQHYIRLMCPASQGRKRTVFFIKSSLFDKIHAIFMNGANMHSLLINPSKFNSYYALYASSSVAVENPRVCVIDDFFMKPQGEVHFVNDKNQTFKKDVQSLPFLELNVWDGQGLISPLQAKKWSQQLLKRQNISKPYCSFGVRNAFIKGCVCTFDFHLLAKKLSIQTITDIWGASHPIQDIDMIISKSMMKLNTNAYSSWEHYTNECKKHNLHWAVTITNKRQDDEMKTTNYQYLQALNLTDKDIKEIADYSVKLIQEIKSENCWVEKLLLFLSNGLGTDILHQSAPFIQALMLCPSLLNDAYIQKKINRLLQKTIEKMSIGKLLLPGNYQIMISDPYAQALFALGLKPKGLLKKRQYYSQFWTQRNTLQVCASRSPLTDYSEHQLLHFVQNQDTEFWYQYLYSGIIYPIGGLDTFVHAGHDYDGDKIYTTSHPVILRSIMANKNCKNRSLPLPPTCHQPKKAPEFHLYKKNGALDFHTLYQADKNIFGNEIGAIANYGASLYALLSRYPQKKYPKEYSTLRNRLTALYRESSNSIDKGKGIEVTPFPKEWIIHQKVTKKDTKNRIKQKKRCNKLAVIKHKKPLFMTEVYPELKKEYRQFLTAWQDQCYYDFGLTLDELVATKEKTVEQRIFLKKYHHHCPVYLDPCNLNRIYWYIQGLQLQKFPATKNKVNLEDIFGYTNTIEQKQPGFSKFKKLFHQYIKEKKEYIKNKKQQGINATESTLLFYALTKEKINQLDIDKTLILAWAIKLAKGTHNDFVWEILGEELVAALAQRIPEACRIKISPGTQQTSGAIEYLGHYYNMEGSAYFDYPR